MKKLFNFIKKLFQNEQISYLFFGVLTTLVNYLVFFIADYLMNLELGISNFLAWIFAVIFAFIVNKKFVFKKKSENLKNFFYELSSFTLARVFSFLLEHFGMLYANKVFGINPYISKTVLAVFVIIMNYIISKFYSFKK